MNRYEQWLLSKIKYHQQAEEDYKRLTDMEAEKIHRYQALAYEAALDNYHKLKGSE